MNCECMDVVELNILIFEWLLATFMSLIMHQEILRSMQGGNRPGERHGARKMRASGQNEFTVF